MVVASVSYLLEISYFFIPEVLPEHSQMMEAGGASSGQPLPSVIVHDEADVDMEPLVRTILVKMEEPDIVLVNNIEDINTDAIMLNAELTINMTQQTERMSFVLTVDRLRGHTCKFNPALREQSLAQILQPTNMGMHFSQDSDTNRTRIDINFNHLVFNVSPASIFIIYRPRRRRRRPAPGSGPARTSLPVTLCLGEHQHYSFSVSDNAHSDQAHQVSPYWSILQCTGQLVNKILASTP